ncbi:MAG: hypothetical protein ACE147_05695 [Candidatus Methylomirabilales bacterium]
MSEMKPAGEHAPAGGATAGHELSDLSPRTIALFGAGLGLLVAVCLIVAAWMFGVLDARLAGREVPASPLARVEPPAGPRLQVDAPSDLARLRAEEDAILSSYDWVDRGAGIVRIPIDQAMARLAEQGLPAPPKEPGAGAPGSGQSQPAKGKGK